MNPKDIKVKISEIIQRNDYIKSFRFILPGVDFKAGQYLFVTVDAGGKKIQKPLSISSAPTEKGYIEFTKKLTSSDFSKALNNLKIGDEIVVRLPFGNFILKEEYNKITFLTGGIGITPVRSICKFLTDTNSAVKASVLLSINSIVDDVFREDFDLMEKTNKNLKVVRTITSTEEAKKNPIARCGYIDKEMIACEVPDCNRRVFYISGPPKMVEGMKCILLEELKIPNAQIITENFMGY